MPLCPPQITQRLARDRTRASAVIGEDNLNYIYIYIYIYIKSVPRSKHFVSIVKTSQLMLYREIIAVCSQIHTKHIITLCGQNVELLNVKLAVHIVITGLCWVKCLLYKPVS